MIICTLVRASGNSYEYLSLRSTDLNVCLYMTFNHSLSLCKFCINQITLPLLGNLFTNYRNRLQGVFTSTKGDVPVVNFKLVIMLQSHFFHKLRHFLAN